MSATGSGLPRHRRLSWGDAPEHDARGPFESLRDHIRRADPGAARPGLPPVLAARVCRDVAEALTCLHLHGLSAGAIDADRVLVGPAGEIVLRPVPAGSPAPDPLDSVGYRDLQVEDRRLLGALMFELFSRRRFTERDRSYLEQGFPILVLARPGTPEAADELVCRLLSTRPGRRFRRIKEVLDGLRRLVDELENPAPPGSQPPTGAPARTAEAPPAPTLAGTATRRLLGGIATLLGAVLALIELVAAWQPAAQ